MSEADEADQSSRRAIRAVKALALFLGIVLIAGLGLVVHAVTSRITQPARPAGAAAPPSAGAAGGLWSPVPIPLATDEEVAEITAAGDRLVVHLSGPQGDRLLVLDPAAGRVAGSFVLTPAAPVER